MTAPADDPLAAARILQRTEALAGRLGEGSAADHVRRSVRELSAAVEQGAGIEPAVQRVMTSLRQLQGEERAGRLRHARGALAVAERLLDAVQQDLVPELQRSGRL